MSPSYFWGIDVKTILFHRTINSVSYNNLVSFNKGVMFHKQIEYRNGLTFMRAKKRRLIH